MNPPVSWACQLAVLLPSLLLVLPGGGFRSPSPRYMVIPAVSLYLLPIGLLIVGFSLGDPAFYQLILWISIWHHYCICSAC